MAFTIKRFPSVLLRPLGHNSIEEKECIIYHEATYETITFAGRMCVFRGKTAREFANIQSASLHRQQKTDDLASYHGEDDTRGSMPRLSGHKRRRHMLLLWIAQEP